MRFQVMNETDGILASPGTFESREAAQKVVDRLRKRFSEQGYYLTTSGRKIAATEVKLSIVPSTRRR